MDILEQGAGSEKDSDTEKETEESTEKVSLLRLVSAPVLLNFKFVCLVSV